MATVTIVAPPFELLPAGEPTWLPAVREHLSQMWRAARAPSDDPIVCALANPMGGSHLSLPCAVGSDDQSIERFLGQSGLDDDPVTFTRLLLFLLDDFVESLGYCYRLAGWVKAPRAPGVVSIWTNYFAKHRQNLLVFHHPSYLFSDHSDSPRWEKGVRNAGNVSVIDQTWFEGRAGLPDVVDVKANDDPAVVVVPLLETFVVAALDYYRVFVREVAVKGGGLKPFETPDHELFDKRLLERIGPHV